MTATALDLADEDPAIQIGDRVIIAFWDVTKAENPFTGQAGYVLGHTKTKSSYYVRLESGHEEFFGAPNVVRSNYQNEEIGPSRV